MKRFLLILLCLTTAFAGHINVLCIGQSNMVGVGSAPYTTRDMDNIFNWISGSFSLIAEPTIAGNGCSPLTGMGNQLSKFYSDTIYMVNASLGGTGLYSGSVRLWNARGVGTLFQASLDSCSVAGIIPDVVFMVQGNTDIAGTDSAHYAIAMNQLAADYRDSLDNANLPVIIAVMGYESGSLPAAIRAAQTAFGNSGNNNNRCIGGLESLTMQDISHYTSASQAIIGRWLAVEYIKWRAGCP